MLLNRPRAHQLMRQAGVDALVATSALNVTYFTDYYCWLDPVTSEYMMLPGASSDLLQSYAILPLDGEPGLIVNPMFVANAADLWVTDPYTFGEHTIDFPAQPPQLRSESERIAYDLLHESQPSPTATDALLTALRQKGLSNAQIGIELDGLPQRTRRLISQSLPRAELKDCSNLLRLLRAVKSQDEIELLRRSAEINEQAATEALDEARPGRPMSQVIHRYRTCIAEMDAHFDHFAYSPKGMGIATEPDYVLGTDDVMYVDFGCSFRHVLSDSGTTLALGAWPSELERTHGALRASVQAGVHAMKLGSLVSSVQRAMQEALEEKGIARCFPHGHSLGLAIRDYPIVMAASGLPIKDDCIQVSSDLALEPDMVINLEAPVFCFGSTSVHVEQTFLMTKEGAQALVPQDRSRPVRPGG
jgi:Xaa-Pro dipeptidase